MNNFIDTLKVLPECNQKVILNSRISRLEKMRDNYNQKIGSIICIKDKNITSDNMLLLGKKLKINQLLEHWMALNCLMIIILNFMNKKIHYPMKKNITDW